MTDLLLQSGLSNLLIALPLALLAWTIQKTGRRPHLAHLVWLLVLVKLLTPPLVTAPVLPSTLDLGVFGVAQVALQPVSTVLQTTPEAPAATSLPSATTLPSVTTVLALIWLIGSLWVFIWSLMRIVRFDRLLMSVSEKAPAKVQAIASELSLQLGIRRTPTIYTIAGDPPGSFRNTNADGRTRPATVSKTSP